jgi:hypothetical protein
VSRSVIKLNLRAHVYGQHRRALDAMRKALKKILVELSNLSYIKTSSNLIMGARSYRTENPTRLGGVRSSEVEHVRG